MLRRKITKELENWKNNQNKMPLVVKGARQVGKTFIIDDFCKNNYSNYVYVNFILQPNLKSIFDGALDVDTIIKNISINFINVNIVPNETVIFLDEIQACPNARVSLKSFALDKRYDVIASGSLLGINLKEVPSFPVGYNDQLVMYPLDFEEFCYATGMSDDKISYVKEYFEKKEIVPKSIHDKMNELFKEYIIVGGMPRIVLEFTINKNFATVQRLQKQIVNDYLDDIAQYASDSEKVKARECFLSIPKHLAKDYKKFRYSLVEKGGTARKFAGSLMWLYDAGIVNFCYNLNIPELPLEGNKKDSEFKVYMNDTGLLLSMLDDEVGIDILNNNIGVYKGAIYENIVAQMLIAKNKKLYYFENNNKLEIDFFIRYNHILTALEVKSGGNTKAKSLISIMDNWGIKKGLKLSMKNIGIDKERDIINLPLYMFMFLE